MLLWPDFLLRHAPCTRAAPPGGADQTAGSWSRTVTEYEILLLLDPDLSEDRQNEIVTRIQETVERGGGGWDRHDVWGRRKLAYEISHKPEGFYHLLLFSSTPEVLDEITRVLRITDGV